MGHDKKTKIIVFFIPVLMILTLAVLMGIIFVAQNNNLDTSVRLTATPTPEANFILDPVLLDVNRLKDGDDVGNLKITYITGDLEVITKDILTGKIIASYKLPDDCRPEDTSNTFLSTMVICSEHAYVLQPTGVPIRVTNPNEGSIVQSPNNQYFAYNRKINETYNGQVLTVINTIDSLEKSFESVQTESSKGIIRIITSHADCGIMGPVPLKFTSDNSLIAGIPCTDGYVNFFEINLSDNSSTEVFGGETNVPEFDGKNNAYFVHSDEIVVYGAADYNTPSRTVKLEKEFTNQMPDTTGYVIYNVSSGGKYILYKAYNMGSRNSTSTVTSGFIKVDTGKIVYEEVESTANTNSYIFKGSYDDDIYYTKGQQLMKFNGNTLNVSSVYTLKDGLNFVSLSR